MDGLKLQEWTLSLSTPVVSTAAISYLPYFIYHPKRIWVGFDMRITIEKTAALRYLGPYPLMERDSSAVVLTSTSRELAKTYFRQLNS